MSVNFDWKWQDKVLPRDAVVNNVLRNNVHMEEKWAYEEDFVHFDSITGQKFNQRTSHQDPPRL